MRRIRFGGGAVIGVVVVGLARLAWADGSAELLPPVLLESEGRPIDTGEAWGHSGPCVADVDGDGVRDLMVGDFSGKFRVFRNVGTDTGPKYGPQTYLMAGGEEAKVRIYCCIGSSPQLVDYDGDGKLDLISGSYDPGECYLFRGLGGGNFAARETIVGADSKPVLRVPEQQQNYQSFGSWPVLVDWDNDGDLDLLVGGFNGTMFVRINEGTREKPVLAATNVMVMVGDDELKDADGHAAPAIVDWDGDGLWDIVAGSASGAVYWYRNIGGAGAPKFEAAKTLIPKHDGSGYSEVRAFGSAPTPGIRTQIFATDYNSDGMPDLIVGDFCTTLTLRPDLTAAERQEADQIRAEYDEITKASIAAREAMTKDFLEQYPGDQSYSEEADKEWQRRYQEFRDSDAQKAREARGKELEAALHQFLLRPAQKGKFDDFETTHGYVWLYLRK